MKPEKMTATSNSHFGKMALWKQRSSPAYGPDGKMPLALFWLQRHFIMRMVADTLFGLILSP